MVGSGVLAAPGGVAADVCGRFEPVEETGAVAEPRLVELSGLAASRRHPGVLWAHNDSGGAPELFALSETGESLGTYPVPEAGAVDWEDMAAGPGPGGIDALYIGDIGDNQASRSTVAVHRVPEPAGPLAAGGSAPLGSPDTIELRYPDGPTDAEALLIDPRTGDLVIVTKSLLGSSRVLTADAASLVAGAPVVLEDAGALDVPRPPSSAVGLPGTAVTGGDVSPDGSIVLLRTYRSVLAFERGDDQSVAEALLGPSCFAPQAEEPQGEALAFTSDGAAFVTASEGANVPIHRVEVEAPATTTTTAPARVDDVEIVADDDLWPIVLGVAVVAALVVGSVLVRRRRSAAG